MFFYLGVVINPPSYIRNVYNHIPNGQGHLYLSYWCHLQRHTEFQTSVSYLIRPVCTWGRTSWQDLGRKHRSHFYSRGVNSRIAAVWRRNQRTVQTLAARIFSGYAGVQSLNAGQKWLNIANGVLQTWEGITAEEIPSSFGRTLATSMDIIYDVDEIE